MWCLMFICKYLSRMLNDQNGLHQLLMGSSTRTFFLAIKSRRGVNYYVLPQTRSRSCVFCYCSGRIWNLGANFLTGQCMSQAMTSAGRLRPLPVIRYQSCSATMKKLIRALFSTHNMLVARVLFIVTTLMFSFCFLLTHNLLANVTSRKEKVRRQG